MGLLSLLDEESRFPKGTDESMVLKFGQHHDKNQYFSRPKLNKTAFSVHHYAGAVTYEATQFLEKNRDKFPDELLEVFFAHFPLSLPPPPPPHPTHQPTHTQTHTKYTCNS